MASRSALMALLVVVSSVAAASAASHTVGDSSGWTLGVNYDTWANGKTFADGDQLGACVDPLSVLDRSPCMQDLLFFFLVSYGE